MDEVEQSKAVGGSEMLGEAIRNTGIIYPEKMSKYVGLLPKDQIGAAIIERKDKCRNMLESNGMLSQWKRNFRIYQNMDPVSYGNNNWGDFGANGDNDSYVDIKINHFRNLITHMLNMIFAKLPDLKARAAQNTFEATSSVALGDSIMENTFKSKRINRKVKKVGELGLVFGTGGALVEWDIMDGEPYVTDGDGRIVNTGDIVVSPLSVLDFFADTNKQDENDVEWQIFRQYKNKYLLAAQFPDMADKILSLSDTYRDNSMSYFDQNESDDIPVYKYYHKPVPGIMPHGRFVMCLDKDVVIYDGKNPYSRIPFFMIKPSEGLGTFYGYTPANDLAPIQIFYNIVMSSIGTNAAAFGIPNIVTEKGSEITSSMIEGGMNLIEVDKGYALPQPLNLMATPPEMYQLTTFIERTMETISGVNSVARGNPDDSLKSGVALGLVQSMAIQFMSGFQSSVINFMEDIGNHVLQLYKEYASTPRIVSITGKDKINDIRRWSSSDLSLIHSMYVEPVDPISQTIAGREARADKLLNSGQVSGYEYLTVATTGQIEPLYKRKMAELNYIRCENEKMQGGEYVEVMITDNHAIHIDEHLTPTFDPDFRTKAQMPGSEEERKMKNLLEHIQKHVMFARQSSPSPVGQQTAQPTPGGQQPQPGSVSGQ